MPSHIPDLLQILRGEFGLLHGRLFDVEGPAAAARLLGVRVGEEEAAADDLAQCIAFCITCTCNMHTCRCRCRCMCMCMCMLHVHVHMHACACACVCVCVCACACASSSFEPGTGTGTGTGTWVRARVGAGHRCVDAPCRCSRREARAETACIAWCTVRYTQRIAWRGHALHGAYIYSMVHIYIYMP